MIVMKDGLQVKLPHWFSEFTKNLFSTLTQERYLCWSGYIVFHYKNSWTVQYELFSIAITVNLSKFLAAFANIVGSTKTDKEILRRFIAS